MNGKSTVFSASAPFALSLSKGERQIDQEIVMHPGHWQRLTLARRKFYIQASKFALTKGGSRDVISHHFCGFPFRGTT
jgi:hypothetical protein